MARRPAGAHDWLREALIARRTRLVERFDCPATRARLEEYVSVVRAGGELQVPADELWLAVHALDPGAAERFERRHRPAGAWTLTADNRLYPVSEAG